MKISNSEKKIMYGKQKCRLNGSLNGTQSIYVHSLAEKSGLKTFLMKIFKISSIKNFLGYRNSATS